MNVPIRPGGETSSLDSVERNSSNEGNEPKRPKIKGKVIVHKPSVGEKVVGALIEEDVGNIRSYIVNDVLIPVVKETICNVVELIFFGSTSRGRGYRNDDRNNTRTSYSSYYMYSRPRERIEDRNSPPRDAKRLNDVVFTLREDAQEFCDRMNGILNKYETASVADFWEECGRPDTFDYPERNWGWRDDVRFDYTRVRNGWLILVPEIVKLKQERSSL